MGSIDQATLDILDKVGIGLGVFYALIILFSVFKGWRRGVIRQTVRTVTILISIIASIVIIKMAVAEFDAACEGNTFAAAIDTLLGQYGMDAEALGLGGEDMAFIMEIDAMIIRDVALSIIAPILFPIIFTVLFIVISFALYILYSIVMLFIRKLRKRNNTKKTRRLGALVGLVQGILVASIFFLPFTNIFDTADKTMEALGDIENEELSEVIETIEALEAPLYNTPMKMSYMLGGKMFANIVSTFDVGGERYNTRKFLPTVAGLAVDVIDLTNIEFDNLTGEDVESVKGIIDKLLDDQLFSNVIIEVLSMFGDLVEENKDMMEIPEEMNELFDAFFEVLKVDKDDPNAKSIIKANFHTILDVIYIVTDSGILDATTDSDALFDALTAKDANGKTILQRIISTLKNNPKTAHIVDILAKLSISLMADQSGFGEEVTEIYEKIEGNFIDNLDEINSAESAADLTPVLKEIFNEALADNPDFDIDLDDDIYEQMAEFVYNDILVANGGELSADDFSSIVFTYYDAMLQEIPME